MKIRPGFSRWLATSALALFELTLCAAADPVRKPNIIFILADDYGIGELGCYGADHYQTPNIDALASSGIRYTHAYTVPLCGPSRALIMTGRYAFRTGAVNQDQTGLFTPAAETMIPRVLKPAGYITTSIGKWGQLPLDPAAFGFDDYMDKLVGKLVAELDRLKLREQTLVIFFGDNGTATARAERATIGGRRLAGAKGSMLEGGGRVPLIASWPGVTPAGMICDDLVDASDFLPTFAELAGAELPPKTLLDGRSFAARLRGENGQPRAWIFNQLAKMWYVRDAGWKLNQAGELFDMSDAPFTEKLIAADTKDPTAIAARKRLQPPLDQLNPAGGIQDVGDGTGRHANKKAKQPGKAAAAKSAEPTKP